MRDTLENPRFAEARAAGKTCFEIDAMGGCIICWGKGRWLGITDADWKSGAPFKRTVMSCPYCRGSGLKPGRAQAEDKT